MQPTTDPLRIGAIGFDERQRNALKMVFEGACQKAYCFSESDPPQAWIIDLDHLGAIEGLQAQWRTHGARPVLFLSLNTPARIEIDGAVVKGAHLRKPFTIDNFIALLPALAQAAREAAPVVAPAQESRVDASRIAVACASSRAAHLLNDEVAYGLVGNAPDVDLADPAQCEQVYYAPERYLQGRLVRAWQRAIEAAQPMAIEGPWPGIVLFPGQNLVQLSVPARQYRPIAIVPDLQGDCRETWLDARQTPFGECIPYPVFLWKLTMWAARGRLPQGTPLDVPVFLRWWPNLTRLDVSPSALAIAALWSREPHSLARTTQVLGVPQRCVFAFYSATKALNLCGQSIRAVDRMLVPQPLPTRSKPQSFLGRVLDKLRLPVG